MNNNPFTEIGTIVLSALLVIGGVILVYTGKVDIAFASSMFILAAGLLGFNGALKAPSPAQQQNLVNLLATHTHPAPPAPPSPPTQPVQPAPAPGTTIPPAALFVPDPGVSMAAYQTGMMQAVTPGQQP